MPRTYAACLVVALAAGAQSRPPQGPTREFGPRACGPADPAYIRIAGDTGGQPFFLSPADLAASSHLLRETVGTSRELLLWASATSGNRPLDFVIPVDPSVRRLTISTSFDREGGTLNVVAPDGTVNPRLEGSEETILNCAHVLTLAAPPPGTWRAHIVATGRAWLLASGPSDVSIDAAEFVERRGRPGHEGLFRIAGQPVAGRPATLRVRVDGYPADPDFEFVAEDGRRLGAPSLPRIDDGGYAGEVTVPAEPFRVAATARDPAGHPIRRMHGPLFRPQRPTP